MILLHFWVHRYPVTDAMQEAEVDRRTPYQWFLDICSVPLRNIVRVITHE